MFTLSEVVGHIEQLYDNQRVKTVDELNKYLHDFQLSSNAWEITLNYLLSLSYDNNNISVILFFSQTLRHKVKYDMVQFTDLIGNEANDQLYNNILMIISNYVKTNKLQESIKTQLIISLVYSMKFVDKENVLVATIETLQQIERESDQYNNHLLLSFLKILPEEINAMSVEQDEASNNKNSLLLEDIRLPVINYIITLINSSDGSNESNLSILKVLRNWVLEFTLNELISLENNCIVNYILSQVYNCSPFEDLSIFEAALEVLSIIIIESKELIHLDKEDIILQLIDSIYSIYDKVFQPLLVSYKETEDLDVLEIIIKFIVDCCESWELLIVKQPVFFEKLLQISIDLTFPLNNINNYQELDFRGYFFKFWCDLQTSTFMKRYEASKPILEPIYDSLFQRSLIILAYPLDSFDELSDKDIFLDYRYHISDFLKSAFKMLTANKFLGICLANLQFDNKPWQYYETIVFILKKVAIEIPYYESKILPEIIYKICDVSVVEQINTSYLDSINLLLAYLSEWTNKNAEKSLEPQLMFLFKQLDMKDVLMNDSNVLISSSNAFMNICIDCGDKLSPFIEQLISFYVSIEKLLDANTMDTENDLQSKKDLSLGITSVICSIKEDYQYIKVLQQFLESKLNNILHYDSVGDMKKLSQSLNILEAVFSEITPRDEGKIHLNHLGDDNLKLIQNVYSNILKPIFVKNITNQRIVEDISHIFVEWILHLHFFIEPILKDLFDLVYNTFKAQKYNVLLVLSAKIMDIYSIDDQSIYPASLISEYVPLVWQFIVKQHESFQEFFIKESSANISNIELMKFGDLINDYTLFVNDTLIYFPMEFFQHTQLSKLVVSFLLTVNKISDFDVSSLALRTLEDLFSWGLSNPPISCEKFTSTPTFIKNAVMNLTQEMYLETFKSLFQVLLFADETDSNLDDNNEVSYDCVECFCKFVEVIQSFEKIDFIIEDGITKILSLMGENIMKEKEAEKFIHGCYIAGKYNDYRKLARTIKTFCDWYKRKYNRRG
ncbi:hypothetical protein QEN19_002147 [Hanseniaspora menglaensis]